jgi:hypothetical protein
MLFDVESRKDYLTGCYLLLTRLPLKLVPVFLKYKSRVLFCYHSKPLNQRHYKSSPRVSINRYFSLKCDHLNMSESYQINQPPKIYVLEHISRNRLNFFYFLIYESQVHKVTIEYETNENINKFFVQRLLCFLVFNFRVCFFSYKAKCTCLNINVD